VSLILPSTSAERLTQLMLMMSSTHDGEVVNAARAIDRLLSTLLAAIAEFERELIRERTGQGRKRAMANGVKFGRKPKLSPYQRAEAIKRRAAGETLAEIARSYAVDISTISRLS
jgi:DNA invertase Pin-like site-specific DNA recombinase